MLCDIISVKRLTSLAVMGLALATVACSQNNNSGKAGLAKPPLPSDSQSVANPAGPNCYPDINHCASYPTGGVSKDNPDQSSPQK